MFTRAVPRWCHSSLATPADAHAATDAPTAIPTIAPLASAIWWVLFVRVSVFATFLVAAARDCVCLQCEAHGSCRGCQCRAMLWCATRPGGLTVYPKMYEYSRQVVVGRRQPELSRSGFCHWQYSSTSTYSAGCSSTACLPVSTQFLHATRRWLNDPIGTRFHCHWYGLYSILY